MEAKRIFKGKDIKMLDAIRTLHTHFKANQAAFSTYDPSFGAAFLADWETAQEIAWSTEEDKSEVTEGEILLEESLGALQKCQVKYKEVKYFAGKAFPANKEILKEFGEGQYSKIRNSPLRMVQFMETLFGVADKYKTQLIAQNYSQAAIDEIATLTDELRADNKAQQLKKTERPTETRHRIQALNTYYSFGQQVVAVAPMVFSHSFAKLKHFRLAEKQHPKVVKSWATLAPLERRKTSLTKLLKKFKLTLTNQGRHTVEYWRADNLYQTPPQKFLLAADQSAEIGMETPAHKFLIVHNSSSEKIRMMLTKEAKK